MNRYFKSRPPSFELIRKHLPLQKWRRSIMMTYFTATEVATHNSKRDLWIINENKVILSWSKFYLTWNFIISDYYHFYCQVYDLTSYLATHPGGDIILKHAGQDATTAITFQAAHLTVPNFIKKLLTKFYLGDVKAKEARTVCKSTYFFFCTCTYLKTIVSKLCGNIYSGELWVTC